MESPVCHVCEKGTFMPDINHKNTSCKNCPNGTYQDETGQEMCK